MDFLPVLLRFLEIYVSIPTKILSESLSELSTVEDAYCFLPEHQRYLTQEYLTDFLGSKSGRIIYEFHDALGIHMDIFQINGHWVLLGPYVEKEWNDQKGEELLATLKIPIAYFLSYKIYYCKFRITTSTTVIRTADAIIQSVLDTEIPYDRELITAPVSAISTLKEKYDEDINNAQERYHLENAFLQCIMEGNARGAIDYMHRQMVIRRDIKFLQFLDYESRMTGPTVFRTLIRKAAENGGVPPVVVDAISQKYALKMYMSDSYISHNNLLEELITEMCAMVRKYSQKSYTVHVRKAVSYIELHLSEQLALDRIANVTGISVTYLTRLFKEEMGMTVVQYIMKQRAMKAAELLKTTRLSIQDISTYVGYMDSNYFVKVFKQHYQMTPSEYRNKYFP